ncbi:histidine kinase [Microtetraspora sp. NBRC 13810]|uniref:sensor histidine kinase n=1 Tax=Microtetraspora sp. NBRC 13810 TaxID=3030990 RepID=UPI0025544AFC|nr:histidine kinase [Microtetraspora sp. NBRC 13810]
MESTAGAARPPGTVDEAVGALLAVSAGGLALLDRHGRFTLVNPAAADILGRAADDLVGDGSPFDLKVRGDVCRTSWPAPGGRRRDLEYRIAPVAAGGYAVWFSDVTDAVRQQERLTAIVRAASSVADAFSLRATLDAVAREVVMTANIAAVQILALDDPQDELRVLGMAGFGDARDFTERLSACRRRGARVRFMDAFQQGAPVVVPNRKPAILADPAWEPLHAIMGYPDWDGFVSMPLTVRGRTVGVINAYYVPGEDPGASSLAFLEAMADHAAVAIDTAALVAQTRTHERRRLARDLHDSVVQQLFSMRMQAKALRAQLDRPDADPASVRSGAEELAELSQSALADLRGLVFELRPLDLAERGLVDAVRVHAESLEARTGLAVDVQAAGGLEPDLGVDAQEDVYRIVQEALHNVIKHAHATEVAIRFARSAGGGLTVEVADNGCGPSRTPAAEDPGQATLGLVSMRERAQRWGGLVAAGPRPAGGWTVAVTLPGPGAGTGDAP